MPNYEVTNVDTGSLVISDGDHSDELLTFAGAGTILAGTILARDSGSLKLVPYVIGGVANENGIPKTVITYDVTAAGAGDVSVRTLSKGTLNATRLIVDADGDASNITAAILDQLRAFGLTPTDVQQLGGY